MTAAINGSAYGLSDGAMSGLDAKVLVLNRYYSAIRVIDARRAFVLLAKEIAEVVAVEDGKQAARAIDRQLRGVAAVAAE